MGAKHFVRIANNSRVCQFLSKKKARQLGVVPALSRDTSPNHEFTYWANMIVRLYVLWLLGCLSTFKKKCIKTLSFI